MPLANLDSLKIEQYTRQCMYEKETQLAKSQAELELRAGLRIFNKHTSPCE